MEWDYQKDHTKKVIYKLSPEEYVEACQPSSGQTAGATVCAEQGMF